MAGCGCVGFTQLICMPGNGPVNFVQTSGSTGMFSFSACGCGTTRSSLCQTSTRLPVICISHNGDLMFGNSRLVSPRLDPLRRQARITELSTSNQKLTADNVSLVEKLRYLKQRQLTGGGGAAGMGGGGATVIRVDSAGVQEQENKAARYSCGPLAFEVAGRRRRQQMGRMEAIADMGGPEARYAHQYERAINPFADFQKAEVEGRVRNLKLHDRVMFATGSLIAGSSLARAALFLYLVLLHMFVMVVTYRNASPQCFVASGG